MKQFLALCALTIGCLQAGNHQTEKFNVPFDFQVNNMTLPAGDYRVQQDFGSDVALLVNTRTGQRVHIIHRMTGSKARLTFSQSASTHTLKPF